MSFLTAFCASPPTPLPPFRSRHQTSTPRCSLSDPAALSADKLSLWWPDGTPALSSISLSIPPGTLAMLAGPNGCGKSTLLRALRNFYIPDIGTCHLPLPTAYVWQDPTASLIFPSVFTNVSVAVPETDTRHPDHWRVRLSDGGFVEEAVFEALDHMGFDNPDETCDRMTSELSGGEKQRVAVASALAMKPRCMLFDEVTASMDARNRDVLMRSVPKVVKEEQIAALWVTHAREELAVADIVYLMDKGRIAVQGPPEAILPIIDASSESYFGSPEPF